MRRDDCHPVVLANNGRRIQNILDGRWILFVLTCLLQNDIEKMASAKVVTPSGAGALAHWQELNFSSGVALPDLRPFSFSSSALWLLLSIGRQYFCVKAYSNRTSTSYVQITECPVDIRL